MAVSRFKDESEGTLLRNRLGLELRSLNERFARGDFEHVEDLHDAFATLIRRFSQLPSSPSFEGRHVRPGDLPDPRSFTEEMLAMSDDLALLMAEATNMQEVLVSNFNSVALAEAEAKQGIKRVRSMLGDLRLYGTGPINDNLHFGDSFTNLSRLDMDSDLLSERQANIATDGGVATLSFGQDQVALAQVARLVVDEGNGVLGNRTEFARTVRSDVTAALDGNPDTWFEYERSLPPGVRSDFEPPLVLGLTAVLRTPSIINRIVLNPNNFGTTNWIRIRDISTSEDGTIHTSILKDIPQSEWTVDERGPYLSLSPEGTRFEGQGVISFLPRKARLVRFRLEQPLPYGTTSHGAPASLVTRRWAIGIRDIVIMGVRYDAVSQLVSLPFESPSEIKKVGILANQLGEEPLVSITHEVSEDDGQSWHVLSLLDRDSLENPETLSFNLGPGSIETSLPVRRLRWRGTLRRNATEFQRSRPGGSRNLVRKSEMQVLPQGNLIIRLERPPVGDVQAVRPLLGTVGWKGAPTVLDASRRVGADGQLTVYEIPFQIPRWWNVNHWSGFEHVTVGGNEWTRVTDSANPPAAGQYFANANDTSYYIDYDQRRLIFGDGAAAPVVNPREWSGRPLDPGLPIAIWQDPEPLLLSQEGVGTLFNHHDFMPESFRIRMFGRTVDDVMAGPDSESREIIAPGAQTHKIREGRLIQTVSTSDARVGAGAAPEYGFEDGRVEFDAGASEFSVDVREGVVHLEVPTGQNAQIELRYTHKPWRELVRGTDWEILDSRRIRIFPHAITRHQASQPIQNSVRRVDLFATLRTDTVWGVTGQSLPELPRGHGTIMEGSVRPPVTATGNPITNGGIQVYRREVPFIDGRREFDIPQDDAPYKEGLWSVDHRNGHVYSYVATPAAGTEPFTFSYVDCWAEYGIGAPIANKVAGNGREILLDETEVLEIFKDSQAHNRNERFVRMEYMHASDEGEPMKDLEPYYTPILRDYSLVVVPVDPRLGEVS